MPKEWTGDIVRGMHLHGVTIKELAEHMNVTPNYVSMVLNSKRDPVGAEERFRAALAELVAEKEAEG